MDNNINQTLPTTKTEDNIVGMKPQAIKMDILLTLLILMNLIMQF